MRKSGAVQCAPAQNPSNDMPIEEDLDPAALYEDEEGTKKAQKLV